MAADFLTAQHAAELALMRMSLMAVLARAEQDDPEVTGLAVAVSVDGFGAPALDVELLGAAGQPVGGFSL